MFYFIALFYYALGNIPPKYRSSLGAIQLFAVLKTGYLEKYGCNSIGMVYEGCTFA